MANKELVKAGAKLLLALANVVIGAKGASNSANKNGKIIAESFRTIKNNYKS